MYPGASKLRPALPNLELYGPVVGLSALRGLAPWPVCLKSLIAFMQCQILHMNQILGRLKEEIHVCNACMFTDTCVSDVVVELDVSSSSLQQIVELLELSLGDAVEQIANK